MEPLRPAVELPIRRGRPAAFGAALAVLFSLGAYNYMAATRARWAGGHTVEVTFATQPAGAEVVRERDGRTLCKTPCRIDSGVGRWGVAGFRLAMPGFEDRRVLVDLRGGDARVEAVLDPLR